MRAKISSTDPSNRSARATPRPRPGLVTPCLAIPPRWLFAQQLLQSSSSRPRLGRGGCTDGGGDSLPKLDTNRLMTLSGDDACLIGEGGRFVARQAESPDMLGDFVAKIAAAFSRYQFIPDFRNGGIVHANGLRKNTVLRQLKKSLSPALDRRFSRLIGLVRAYI